MTTETPDLQQAFANVLTQSARCTGPALGFISADVAVLRLDHATRMARAEQIIADTARILATLPPRRTPAASALGVKLTALTWRIAGMNVTLQLAALRQRLTTPPQTN